VPNKARRAQIRRRWTARTGQHNFALPVQAARNPTVNAPGHGPVPCRAPSTAPYPACQGRARPGVPLRTVALEACHPCGYRDGASFNASDGRRRPYECRLVVPAARTPTCRVTIKLLRSTVTPSVGKRLPLQRGPPPSAARRGTTGPASVARAAKPGDPHGPARGHVLG
jgi:hypothetical protein